MQFDCNQNCGRCDYAEVQYIKSYYKGMTSKSSPSTQLELIPKSVYCAIKRNYIGECKSIIKKGKYDYYLIIEKRGSK